MDAILVKYLGPTAQHGARMKASIAGKPSVTRAYDSELSTALNARQCASDLLQSLDFNRFLPFWAMGTLGNDYVFVAHSAKPHMDAFSIDTRNWLTNPPT